MNLGNVFHKSYYEMYVFFREHEISENIQSLGKETVSLVGMVRRERQKICRSSSA